MTTKEMYRVLESLAPSAGIDLDINGRWFVSLPGAAVIEDGMWIGATGRGETTDDAIRETFKIFTVAECVKSRDKYYRWTGYMWQETQP